LRPAPSSRAPDAPPVPPPGPQVQAPPSPRDPARVVVTPGTRVASPAAEIQLPELAEFDHFLMERRSKPERRAIDLARAQVMRRLADALGPAFAGCAPETTDPILVRSRYRLSLVPPASARIEEVLGLHGERGAPLAAAAQDCLVAVLRAQVPITVALSLPAGGALPPFQGTFSLTSSLNSNGQCELF
jgi:hypothetical protein